MYHFFFFFHQPEPVRPTLSAKEAYKCRGEDRCLDSSNFLGHRLFACTVVEKDMSENGLWLFVPSGIQARFSRKAEPGASKLPWLWHGFLASLSGLVT